MLIPKVRRLNLSAQHVVYMHYTVGTLREKFQCWWVHQRQNEGSLYHFQYSNNIFTRLNDSRIKSISELVTSFVESVNGDDSCSLCLEILYEVLRQNETDKFASNPIPLIERNNCTYLSNLQVSLSRMPWKFRTLSFICFF